MTVKLLHHTPLWVASTAIRKCWASEGKSDTGFYEDQDVTGEFRTFVEDLTVDQDCEVEAGTKDKALIERVGNKNKHASTLEHLSYNFDIDGISRACLQELARHRIASYSIKSTRYTLKGLKDTDSLDYEKDFDKFLVSSSNKDVNLCSWKALLNLKGMLENGASNDVAKYCLPESYKTSLVMTINARSLQNFLTLRSSKAALGEIRDLANAIFEALPQEHSYLFKDSLAKDGNGNT